MPALFFSGRKVESAAALSSPFKQKWILKKWNIEKRFSRVSPLVL